MGDGKASAFYYRHTLNLTPGSRSSSVASGIRPVATSKKPRRKALKIPL